MITKGMLLKAKTKTAGDVYGDVTWEVAEVGVSTKRGADGVKLVMLGGTGSSARKGVTIIDTESHILAQMASGVVSIVPESRKASIEAFYADKKSDGSRRPAGGCVEC